MCMGKYHLLKVYLGSGGCKYLQAANCCWLYSSKTATSCVSAKGCALLAHRFLEGMNHIWYCCIITLLHFLCSVVSVVLHSCNRSALSAKWPVGLLNRLQK